jgi:peptide/nickel transport system substrate-binding protein
VFTLSEPFASFPTNLVIRRSSRPGPGRRRVQPGWHGSCQFVRHLPDNRVELAAFEDYWAGRPANEGLVLRVVPDEVMRGLELRKGTIDLVVNDVSPDILYQLRRDEHLQTATAPGVDYQYIGVNLLDPALGDVRVRRALAHAIDRQAIVDHLRRGLATPADGLIRRSRAPTNPASLHMRSIRRGPELPTRPATATRTATAPLHGCD